LKCSQRKVLYYLLKRFFLEICLVCTNTMESYPYFRRKVLSFVLRRIFSPSPRVEACVVYEEKMGVSRGLILLVSFYFGVIIVFSNVRNENVFPLYVILHLLLSFLGDRPGYLFFPSPFCRVDSRNYRNT